MSTLSIRKKPITPVFRQANEQIEKLVKYTPKHILRNG